MKCSEKQYIAVVKFYRKDKEPQELKMLVMANTKIEAELKAEEQAKTLCVKAFDETSAVKRLSEFV